MILPDEWHKPPAEFSLAPFWFWNDELDEAELVRQMEEMQAHGVDAFVIHPRLGLPEHLGWMSRGLLNKMRFAIEQAQARGMWVVLYDEGMYPSGSSAGQVVAENPAYQCHGLVRINLDTVQPNSDEQGITIGVDGQIALAENQTLIAEVGYQGQSYAIVCRPIDSVIRGLHYIDETVIDVNGESQENSPLAADLLNSDAVACFIRLVYDRYFEEFGVYFGTVIPAIFTDEPMLLGRSRETGVMPGTTDILQHVNDFLGYDFTPFLPALWDENAPQQIRDDYEQAVENRLLQTYYTQLFDWCETHHIALTGHPHEPDATTHLRYFHFPGQDIVWRYIEPDTPSALEGRQSTQAKAASSMMLHTGRRRNGNEFCGAYGHNLTYEEMCWLANWLLIRGCNLLFPHAFYYSMRGARKNERPPDVGLNSSWWDERFTRFALASRRLCWLNTDSQQVCHVAILGEQHYLPTRAAKVCYEHQIDFNYLDVEDLLHSATITNNGIQIANQQYQVLIVDSPVSTDIQNKLAELMGKVTVIYWSDGSGVCLSRLRQAIPADLAIMPQVDGLRVRHVQKSGYDWYILFNETRSPIEMKISLELSANSYRLDPYFDTIEPFTGHLYLDGHAVRIIVAQSL
jgi:hypothetical protein